MGLLRNIASWFIVDDDTSADAPAGAAKAKPAKRTLLIIDDDQTLLRTLRGLLLEAGFEVLTSATGPKGLNTLRYAPNAVDAVLLDFSMPTFNGAQTLDYLRKLAPGAKVVGVSGYDPKRLPPRFRDGVDAFIQKPFTSADLIALLTAILDGASLTANERAPAAAGQGANGRNAA